MLKALRAIGLGHGSKHHAVPGGAQQENLIPRSWTPTTPAAASSTQSTTLHSKKLPAPPKYAYPVTAPQRALSSVPPKPVASASVDARVQSAVNPSSTYAETRVHELPETLTLEWLTLIVDEFEQTGSYQVKLEHASSAKVLRKAVETIVQSKSILDRREKEKCLYSAKADLRILKRLEDKARIANSEKLGELVMNDVRINELRNEYAMLATMLLS